MMSCAALTTVACQDLSCLWLDEHADRRRQSCYETHSHASRVCIAAYSKHSIAAAWNMQCRSLHEEIKEYLFIVLQGSSPAHMNLLEQLCTTTPRAASCTLLAEVVYHVCIVGTHVPSTTAACLPRPKSWQGVDCRWPFTQTCPGSTMHRWHMHGTLPWRHHKCEVGYTLLMAHSNGAMPHTPDAVKICLSAQLHSEC